MYRVLLISLVNWDSLIELPALLKDAGCVVDIYCVKSSWALQNKSYNEWIPGDTDPDIFAGNLIDFVKTNGHKYEWILPGDDIVIRILNEKITDVQLFYKVLPLTKIENRELLGSKAGFSTLCTKYSIKTPRYLVYEESITPHMIGEYMKYPFLLKLDKSEGGFGVFLCNAEADLISNLSAVQNRETIVFQQFIKGYDINTEVLYKNGELIAYNYSRTLNVMGKFGVSTERLFYQRRDIEPELIRMGRELGLNGFGNVVFMYSEAEDAHYLIEIDMRPNAWMYYGKFTGTNFSEAVKMIIKGNLTLLIPLPEFADKKIKVRLYKKDIYRCMMEKDIKCFLAWITNKDHCLRYIPFYDGRLLAACNKYLFSSFRELVINKFRKNTP